MKNKSITIIHGSFKDAFYDDLQKRKLREVFVTEGRPSLKSSKDSVKALQQRNILPTVISDNMAGFLFYKDYVKEVYVAYQEKDKEGILAQIGSLVLSVLAKTHNVAVKSVQAKAKLQLMGKPESLHKFNGKKVVDQDVKTFVPLVEWVDRKYLTEIIEYE